MDCLYVEGASSDGLCSLFPFTRIIEDSTLHAACLTSPTNLFGVPAFLSYSFLFDFQEQVSIATRTNTIVECGRSVSRILDTVRHGLPSSYTSHRGF